MAENIEIDEAGEVDEIVVYGEGIIPLDEDAFVYIIADIQKMRPIFDIIPVNQLKSWQAALVMDRTEMAVAALFPLDSGRFFQIAGFGAYPSFTANLALFMHRNWKYSFAKKRNYYYSNADRLSVRLTSDEAYIVAWRYAQVNPLPEGPGVKTPEGFMTFRHRSGEPAPLSLWVENHNAVLNNIFAHEGVTINIPVGKLYLNLYHVEDAIFKAELLLQTSNPFPRENFTIRLPSRSNSVLRSLFFANPPVQNGRNIEFQSAPLSEEELFALMVIFMRNWK